MLRNRGGTVLPCFDFLRNNEATVAPMLLNPDSGLTVLPDCLVWSKNGSTPQVWTEVKAKHEPGFMRVRARWEHGCDFRKWQEYRRIVAATRFDFYLVVWEKLSPAPGRKLVERNGGTWLYASFADLEREGVYQRFWPSAEESARSGGGWLWPRRAMHELKPQMGFFDVL